MLVLSRRPNEQVIIGESLVTITVLESKGKNIRLGFSAPPNVRIRRQELNPKADENELVLSYRAR